MVEWCSRADNAHQAPDMAARHSEPLGYAFAIPLYPSCPQDKDLKSYVEEAQTHGLSVVVVHNEKVNPYFKAAATHSIEWEPFLASFVPFFKTTGRSTAPGSCTQTPSAAPVPIPTECNLPAHMAEVPPRSQVAESEEISLRPMSLRPGGEGKNPFAAFGKRTVVADEVKHQTQRQSPQVSCWHVGRHGRNKPS